MDCGRPQRVIRTFMMSIVSLALVCFSVACFVSAELAVNEANGYGDAVTCERNQVFEGTCLPDTDCECVNGGLVAVLRDAPAGIADCCREWRGAQYKAKSVMVAASAAPVMLNLLIGYAIEYLAHFSKSRTITAINQRIFATTVVMQLASIVLAAVLVNADFGPTWRGWVDDAFAGWGVGSDNFPMGCGAYANLTPEWYIEVGATIVASLCISAIGIPLVFPMWYLIHMVLRRFCARRAQTSEQLKELFIRPPYDIALISAFDATMIMACIIFAAGLPILWCVLATYLSLSYVMKKYTFLRGSKEPPHFSHHLSWTSVRCVQHSVLLHCLFAVWVFSTPQSLPSYVENYGLELVAQFNGDIHHNLSRWNYKNTQPAFFVMAIVLAVVAIRLLVFVAGKVATRLAVAHVFRKRGAVRAGAGASRTQPTEHIQSASQAVGSFINQCVADTTSSALEDSLMCEAFYNGPCQKFRRMRIPWSYRLENNEDYKLAFGSLESRAGSMRPTATSSTALPSQEQSRTTAFQPSGSSASSLPCRTFSAESHASNDGCSRSRHMVSL